MTANMKIGVGTRTETRRGGHTSTAESQAISREEREEWIKSVTAANLDEGGLPNIPPREGMEQRWMRSRLGAEAAVKNLAQKQTRGWRPRPASSVQQSYQNMRLAEGRFDGAIGVHDMILMERPIEIGAEARQIENAKVDDLDRAVRFMQFGETKGHEREQAYVRHEDPELDSRVETGSRPVDIPD